jgi:hypothetical protein
VKKGALPDTIDFAKGEPIMSAESSGNAKNIFLQAIELTDEAAREAFVAEACGNNELLSNRVKALLVAHDRPESLLDHAAVEHESAKDLPITAEFPAAGDRPTVIGPYKLREQIGEGGMGTVFVAEQERPLRRKVALNCHVLNLCMAVAEACG